MNWYFEVLKKYFRFRGRASREEYWYFTLFHVMITAILTLVDLFLLGSSERGIGLLSLAYTILVFLPGITVSVRRLHDTNRSGWWLLISFIPLLGALLLLYWYIGEGTPGENQYGLNPKQPELDFF